MNLNRPPKRAWKSGRAGRKPEWTVRRLPCGCELGTHVGRGTKPKSYAYRAGCPEGRRLSGAWERAEEGARAAFVMHFRGER